MIWPEPYHPSIDYPEDLSAGVWDWLAEASVIIIEMSGEKEPDYCAAKKYDISASLNADGRARL